MRLLHQNAQLGSWIVVVMSLICFSSLQAQKIQILSKSKIAGGWHPWYEAKVDPENPYNLLICGTKWDARLNTSFGFVYASSDRGQTWRSVLEDRSSAWVTEQSCAFGPKHRAFFISEASKVIDGQAHHELGATRLYISFDAGLTWKESAKTGWADWSTSAVNLASGRLYTFFNAYTAADPTRNLGSNVGLLMFSPDGRSVSGPFFLPSIQSHAYQGTYPSGAISLKSGTVVTLWYGQRLGPAGMNVDLNVLRADNSPRPRLESTSISPANGARDCLALNQGSLAYDPLQDRLFVLYVTGCTEKRVMLTSSGDQARTWSKGVAIVGTTNSLRNFTDPSLVVARNGLAVLWEAGEATGHWLFSSIQDQKVVGQAIEVSGTTRKQEVSNDSLLTWTEHSNSSSTSELTNPPGDLIVLNVHNEGSSVWRGSGLLSIGDDKFLAVWPSINDGAMELHSAILSRANSSQGGNTDKPPDIGDVTEHSVVLYGGMQEFDVTTSTLTVCLILRNRGSQPMRVPIRLKASEIRSSIGSVTITNATNGVAGEGAAWDISNSLTGDQIPAGASSNPFCLGFHFDRSSADPAAARPVNLLKLRMQVFASHNGDSEAFDRMADSAE
ncbi:MAG: hypothetical protein JWQ87_1011 [Candidatus Sulfotelmatobacter sp.]|nr:hypothetical protein [Candidatus Sulfotelmatobacter sp.]